MSTYGTMQEVEPESSIASKLRALPELASRSARAFSTLKVRVRTAISAHKYCAKLTFISRSMLSKRPGTLSTIVAYAQTDASPATVVAGRVAKFADTCATIFRDLSK